jgi:hypothetical protein
MLLSSDQDFDYSLHAAYMGCVDGQTRRKAQGLPSAADTIKQKKAARQRQLRQSSSNAELGKKDVLPPSKRERPRSKGGIYRQLDGSPYPNLRLEPGFDPKEGVTDLELRHIGVAKGIPTKRARTSRLERYADPSDIPRGVYSHTQRVGISGAVISQQEAMELAVQMPQWITLRESYMKQLYELAQLVSRGKIKENDDARRQQFLLLLVALRKVSIRIITEYKFQLGMASETREPEYMTAARSIKPYILSMVTCLDYLSVQPFLSWIGVQTTSNPFLSTTSIDGASAELDGASLAYDLRFVSAEDLHACAEMSSVLATIVEQDQKKQERRRLRAEQGLAAVQGGPPAEDLDDDEKEEIRALQDEQFQRKIGSLVESTHSSLARVPQSRGMKVILTGKSTMKMWWRKWRKAFIIHVRVPVSIQSRNRVTMRKCFDILARNVWQCVKFRALQQHYLQRITTFTFEAWKEYLKWCRKFQRVRDKSVKRVKRTFLRAMRRFADEVYDVRRFRFNNDMRNKKICFTGLKRNVTLTKFELKKRLEKMSSASFMERHTCQRCFHRWAGRSRLVHRLDDLEERVELSLLKIALVKWYLCSRNDEGSGPKRSFAERMKLAVRATSSSSFPSSSTGSAVGGWKSNFLGGMVASKSMTRESEGDEAGERIAMHLRVAEEGRRARMANALAAALM